VYHPQYVNRFVAGIFFRTDYLEEDHRVANLLNLLPRFGEGEWRRSERVWLEIPCGERGERRGTLRAIAIQVL
jgi:hypothetical protein